MVTAETADLGKGRPLPRSASDVVRAGLRLLEEHEAKVKALQDALIAGEDSGEPQPFDFEAFKARNRVEHEGR
ncbi:type II toxin-antitoxin system ParD family antitoxin [Pleomorphomonas sp. NRK KF1]|uniref:type II toxin-antitoxin system ParD family antitoxin n=1 Tax=Pleomorphomonas sp. NRK KF1 TaxID=2943000 RepID=UPI002112CA10|nr:type II toxin-antitoxin system ParD family antitoxin [Pleomorphomonas sp. NRK KF1]